MDDQTIIFATMAAALFGVTVHLQAKGLDSTDHLTGTAVTVATMAAIFWCLAPFVIEWGWWHTRAALIFAVCGLIFPALSQQFQAMAVSRLGAALGSPLASMAPVFAAIPAVIFLGETLTLRLGAGIALMIAAAAASSIGRRGIPRGWPLWALAIPVGASFFRGIVQPASKFGMQEVPSPFFSVLVMSTVSTFVVIGLRLSQSTAAPAVSERTGLFWFAMNGAASGLGILAMQAAIQTGTVVVVAPLVSATPLWALLFGWLVFRRESLGARHLAVTGLVMTGILLIVTA